jgi:CoA:oxalate CoA-transferase
MMAPLDGIRVLAIEQYYAGNIGSLYLSRFGAEVIKLEPIEGDVLRGVGPQTMIEGQRRSVSELRTMGGKSSIALDLKSPGGIATFWRLVENVDVVWTNMKPRSLIDLGIEFDALVARNPRIVYTTISGFGHSDVIDDGPYASWTAFDLIAQGLAGLQYRAQGVGDEPGYNGLPLGDFVTAVMAAMGTVMALLRRQADNQPQRVDVSMHDAMIALNELPLGLLSFTGNAPTRGKSGTSAPYGAYRTSDGFVNIAIGGDPIWRRFCEAAGMSELATDPRFAMARNRVENGDVLDTIVAGWASRFTSDQVVMTLNAGSVPCAPIYNLHQVIASPQVAARNMLLTITDPIAGLVRIVGNPIKMSGHDDEAAKRPPPPLAADTGRILRDIAGFDQAAIDALVASGAVALAGTPPTAAAR